MVDDGSLVVLFEKLRGKQIRLRFKGKSHKLRLCRIAKQRKDGQDEKESGQES